MLSWPKRHDPLNEVLLRGECGKEAKQGLATFIYSYITSFGLGHNIAKESQPGPRGQLCFPSQVGRRSSVSHRRFLSGQMGGGAGR